MRATHGIYPPLGPVPELARVNPASLKRYFAETPIPIGETVLGETVRSGKPLLIRDARQDDRMAANRADDILFVSSLAAIPLVVRKPGARGALRAQAGGEPASSRRRTSST